ncbi:COX5B subunit VB of cytochrome c oxidase [Agaricus bisporus var. burnettii JB137-S8]|uniref:COX5B subunit VB of cytochrome c oxidase n=1 Tax=Agaricus bisporus var. burnettii (strain JB137-S8 / ATCC MYA-4627 / FGSC 10392) TaxID=597362 RepID=K5VWB5_AGABU|nr:COX5B subunit VB of cytochrome c oxidase [Agaricus bisporus var. burnettii JB137-S8]EKM78769.1 COX5B subunit VB of cytochrome c oxidase [Agaricus bisporus var. burnettii JB137-S8]
MFKTALRATRPAILAARAANRQQVSRAFSTTLRVASGGPPPPELYGPGAKPGTVPTDLDQSTGLERLQLLGEIEGINVFEEGPLDSSRIGTRADPVRVPSYDVERIIGCTGSPADSHDITWFTLRQHQLGRCKECGSFYNLDYLGEEQTGEHH